MACSTSFYMGTERWQVAVQGAYYGGETALCIGGAKVVGDARDVMLNFQVVPDSDKDDIAYTGGVLFLF